MNIEYIVELMKKEQYRITPQRKKVLEVLLSHQDKLLTVESLLELTQRLCGNINLTTIYRNLEILDNMHLLYKINIDKNKTAYKLKSIDYHHHLICIHCGKMIPIDYCPMTSKLEELINKNNFELVDHVFDIYGICSECKN